MNAWKTGLAGWGVNIDIQLGPCAVADRGYCVTVNKAPPDGSACAEIKFHGDPVTGVADSSPVINVRTDSWDAAYLDYLLTHEFGHFSLRYGGCPPPKSIMTEGGVNAV